MDLADTRVSKMAALAALDSWIQLLRKPWFVLGLSAALWVVLAASPLHGLDFGVYREGAAVFLGGERSIYDPVPIEAGTRGLPFTYPPFAALIFLPFALMPVWLGFMLITATSCLCLVAVAVLVVEYLERAGTFGRFASNPSARGVAVILATALIGLLGPWRESLDFGQINAMIMLLVVVDLLRPPGRIPRGFLIGLAAGIKLTPLVFGLIFLARRDFRSILAMGAGLASTLAAGWLLAPEESRTYWFKLLGDPARIGDPDTLYNMSLNALTFHLGLGGGAQRAAWILLCLTVVGLGYLAIRSLDRGGDHVVAIVANAVVMLAISPISWFHHWVWAALFIPVAWVMGGRLAGLWRTVGRVLALAIYPAFVLSSVTVTLLLTGEVQETGPLAWKLLSNTGLVLSLTTLGLWAFAPQRAKRLQPALIG